MEIRVRSLRKTILIVAARVESRVGHVVVDGDVDTFDVDAAAEDVGADADAVDEVFEVGVAFDAFPDIVVSGVLGGMEGGTEWETYRSS